MYYCVLCIHARSALLLEVVKLCRCAAGRRPAGPKILFVKVDLVMPKMTFGHFEKVSTILEAIPHSGTSILESILGPFWILGFRSGVWVLLPYDSSWGLLAEASAFPILWVSFSYCGLVLLTLTLNTCYINTDGHIMKQQTKITDQYIM